MGWVNDENAALLTDLYELTMASSYHTLGMTGEATFDLFVRELPPTRNFLVAAGLDDALAFLEGLHFGNGSRAYLRSLGLFDDDFLDLLETLRFTGEVRAVREGEIVFPGEPLLSVTAPLIEAQIVETFLLNAVTFQTMIASKAARVSIACGEHGFVDFSARRDHGADAALKAARAAFIGGAYGTSNVLAGKIYGMPVSGTMAHSYVMAFEDEVEAFRSFCRTFPQSAVLLIDTFDVEEGARRAARVARELEPEGVTVRGVRIDSGSLAPLTRSVRKILDEAGLDDTLIVLSGDLDEHRIKDLLDDGVPADRFGVGTQLGTSADAPALGSVYKLVAEGGEPKIKLSTGKATLPGRKQIHRFFAGETFARDVIALEDETVPEARGLLGCVMAKGRRLHAAEPLEDLQKRCRARIAALPGRLRTLDRSEEPYRVDVSDRLRNLVETMRRRGA
ncbi:MAG: nicotinate phosphoribosyltransferase [Actinomycetota bacterium]